MRKVIARILTWQSARYIRRYKPKIVVVTGSVGKTTTTQAIATVLEQRYKVRKTRGNYNTDLGVACSIFADELPQSPYNPFSWLRRIVTNEMSILRRPDFRMLVLELGTDKPGDIAAFSWLKPHLAVVCAVAPEHMEFFRTLDAVAAEELAVIEYAERTLINTATIPQIYTKKALLRASVVGFSRETIRKYRLAPKDFSVVGEHSIEAVAAAAAAGRDMGLTHQEIVQGCRLIRAQKGRMNILRGINKSVIIDDTYNASPQAVQAALRYLYSQNAPQRIALLGNMNELGEVSRQEHLALGQSCDPEKLDLVVTLGPDANKYTAQAARAHGCRVHEAETPYEAARFIKHYLQERAVILCKGSQNGIFAEEAVKLLLANQADRSQLVRQSAFWLSKKLQQFPDAQPFISIS